MSAIIYTLTVLYFSYAIYVVLGTEIGIFIKNNFPNHSSLLSNRLLKFADIPSVSTPFFEAPDDMEA